MDKAGGGEGKGGRASLGGEGAGGAGGAGGVGLVLSEDEVMAITSSTDYTKFVTEASSTVEKALGKGWLRVEGTG